jgi:hypothetical protein
MKKISTLFKKDPSNLGRVINEINPENKWVFEGNAIATRKYDGTACAIINGELYKRYDVKKGKDVPFGAIPCQEADLITGHWPHWIKCDRNNPADKFHFEAFNKLNVVKGTRFCDGTYELIGEKVQGNPEKIIGHELIEHGKFDLDLTLSIYEFDDFKEYLSNVDIEGIVFHNTVDGRMCKLRKSDFGIKR